MRLSVVMPVLGQHPLATLAIRHVLKNISLKDTRLYVVDNGGDYECPVEDPRIEVNYAGKNLGVYPVFKEAFDQFEGDVLLFIHSDLIIDEPAFDEKMLKVFEIQKKLGLMGFVGSNEIDAAGGRGGGTTSNFKGKRYVDSQGRFWMGSPAEAHGRRHTAFSRAAVVDGCAMAIRREAWEKIGYREGFPPHHFYDRLISTQMLEAGFEVGVFGMACDHISGQTVSREERYVNMAQEWAEEHIPADRWVGNPPNWSWDQTIYREAERQWLAEYRDQKHIVPVRV